VPTRSALAQPARSRRTILAVVLLGVVATLTLYTVLVVADPNVGAALVDARLDLVIGTLATLIALAVALLAWGRYRESGEVPGLFRGSAFLTLATLNALIVGAMLFDLDFAFGLSLDRPGQLPLLGNAAARGLAAVLLLFGGLAALRSVRAARWPALLIVAGPALLLVAALVVGAIVQSSLPAVLGPNEVAQLRAHPEQPILAGAGLETLAIVQMGIGLAFAASGACSYVAYVRQGQLQEAYLSIGLVIAAFSQLHAAIHPGVYVSVVTTGDLLRVAFYAVLLLGVIGERRADLRAIRRANIELQRLHEAELAQATHEERARLAREIHDGLAQDLWYAKLKQARLANMGPMPAEARALAEEVATAIDSSLAEARQAVMALRPTESGPFAEVLTRYVEDFGDRFGIRVDCAIDSEVEVGSPRALAELLRIVQEALNNVRRHADATLVRVEASHEDGALRIRVADNGRGFDASMVGRSGYGLRSMAERAEMVGGRLTIDTRLQDGTRVEIVLPTGGAA
jgi:signal transduction histidine kinase